MENGADQFNWLYVLYGVLFVGSIMAVLIFSMMKLDKYLDCKPPEDKDQDSKDTWRDRFKGWK